MAYLLIEVDDEDADLLQRMNSVLMSTTRGAKPLHMAVAERMGITGEVVDHIDRNPCNNKRSNLRGATKSQNGANRRSNRNNTSGYKGVIIRGGDTAPNKYRARIKLNYKGVHLGSFPTAEEAARAYDRAAIEAWGEFAVTNFPREDYA